MSPIGDTGVVSTLEEESEKAMIEDKANEKLKKVAQDLGLIVNAGADKPKPQSKVENKKKADKK